MDYRHEITPSFRVALCRLSRTCPECHSSRPTRFLASRSRSAAEKKIQKRAQVENTCSTCGVIEFDLEAILRREPDRDISFYHQSPPVPPRGGRFARALGSDRRSPAPSNLDSIPSYSTFKSFTEGWGVSSNGGNHSSEDSALRPGRDRHPRSFRKKPQRFSISSGISSASSVTLTDSSEDRWYQPIGSGLDRDFRNEKARWTSFQDQTVSSAA
jgi:hypothetical protein